MRKFFTAKTLYFVLRFTLGLMFIYAGASKLTDPGLFAQIIDGYGLVSWSLAKKLAYGLPIFEIATGLALVIDIRGSLGVIVAQLLGFMAILLYAIHLGLDVDCGCFGLEEPGETGSGSLWESIIRDILMLGACLVMYWIRRATDIVPRRLAQLFSLQGWHG